MLMLQKPLAYPLFLLSFISLHFFSCQPESKAPTSDKIDREAVVARNLVQIKEIDTLGSLSVGNGEFAFTVDASGLQTFPEYYENGISLGTQSQWGWHSFPDSGNYTIEDVAENFESCNDKVIPYATQHSEGRAGAASNWLRTNPHRLHLGIVGLEMVKENGEQVTVQDLKEVDQQLDLWQGIVTSKYSIEGNPVAVTLVAHPEKDQISVQVHSPLVANNRLKIRFKFPYGNDCHVCPGYDWDHPEKHQSEIQNKTDNQVTINRTLDTTHYSVGIAWAEAASFTAKEQHYFVLEPAGRSEDFSFSVLFSPNENENPDNFQTTEQQSQQAWNHYWNNGGFIDFGDCTDPRAKELERRVILSQYLTRIQCAGSLPPQETGLTMNSWYGKFHLEMHWWHEAQFALWNHLDLLERSMGWYPKVMDKAQETAQWQGYAGARWQKMTGPEGRKSPSSVGELLAWQQPHPIYFAELIYRQEPDQQTLNKYKEMVFQTAEFMASYAQFNEKDGKYHLCHPIIPAQEIFKPETTDDPPFELSYWHYALDVAQQWRERLGMEPNENWQKVLENLAPIAVHDNHYLPNANTPDAYTNEAYRHDHPIVLGAYGMLPGKGMVDPRIMGQTFETIFNEWNWESTWGWDYPMIAMAAARLDKPDKAIDALFKNMQKNTFLVNGHNYQDKRLRLYLPGNGALLMAVAMMAAGWDDGPEKPNPGFPDNGKWNIKWEGLQPMP